MSNSSEFEVVRRLSTGLFTSSRQIDLDGIESAKHIIKKGRNPIRTDEISRRCVETDILIESYDNNGVDGYEWPLIYSDRKL